MLHGATTLIIIVRVYWKPITYKLYFVHVKNSKYLFRLTSTWKTGTIIQVEEGLSRLTLDILGECIFGYDFGCIENPSSPLVAALYRLASVKDMNVLRLVVHPPNSTSQLCRFAG